MSGLSAAPVIIKRKKIIQGGGHHGGAWKVAYADFVTAMMAFFMLMWLLNATTEQQREGLADYFNPTITVNRVSGGGDGAFGGDSIFSEDVMAQSGTGASAYRPTPAERAMGATQLESTQGADGAADEPSLEEVEKALIARGGESMTMERLLRHVVTRVTDEGLVVEIFDLPGAPLFRDDTADPRPVLNDIADLLAEVFALVSNGVAVHGHVRSYPIVMIENPVWDLSVARAEAMRGLLGRAGVPERRAERVAGHADRRPAAQNPMVARNNRLEVILLRRDR
jgi:chemotaxis protein MotB